jgi:two-component system response regulator FixJ
MSVTNQTVFIIDDDYEVCEALRYLFESVCLQVKTYKAAQLFLNEYTNQVQGCIVADVRMPGMGGLELLEQLRLLNNRLPVLIITGYSDVHLAIQAMKLGAADFLIKPFNDQLLLEEVQKHTSLAIAADVVAEVNRRISGLTERERQIIDMISEGKLNKQIANELTLSISTVEAHRSHIMKKMQAKNLAQLIKLYYINLTYR